MINRARPPVPGSLSRNASRWKRELLAEVRKSKKTGATVPRKFFDKYNQDDVKAALAKMYDNLCCYCDSRIGIVDFPHIEHRKPLSIFPRNTFEWSNLHLACTLCNLAKSNKWDKHHPILDAEIDKPITDHLDYELMFCMDKTLRGKTTIDHADLNRDGLRNARVAIFWKAIRIIEKINRNPGHTRAIAARQELQELSDEQYGSFIDYLMRAFLR